MSLQFKPIPQELSAISTKEKCVKLAYIFFDKVIEALRETVWFPLSVDTEGVSNAVIDLVIEELKKVGYKGINDEEGPSLIIENPYIENPHIKVIPSEKQELKLSHYDTCHFDISYINDNEIDSLFEVYYNNATIVVLTEYKKTLCNSDYVENIVKKLKKQGYEVSHGTCGGKNYECVVVTNFVHTDSIVSFQTFVEKLFYENVSSPQVCINLATLDPISMIWMKERGYKVSYAMTNLSKTPCLVVKLDWSMS